MKIVNDDLMMEFRLAKRCGWCAQPRPGGFDPHHLHARGFGGGSRLDVRINLLPLCRECHQNVHTGVITLNDLLAIVAQREGTFQDVILSVIHFLRRVPNGATASAVGRALLDLEPVTRTMAMQILAEVRDRVPAASAWWEQEWTRNAGRN